MESFSVLPIPPMEHTTSASNVSSQCIEIHSGSARLVINIRVHPSLEFLEGKILFCNPVFNFERSTDSVNSWNWSMA